MNYLSNEGRREQSRFERKERAGDQLELKDVMDALAKRDNDIKVFAEKASQEIKEHGTMLADTKTVLEGLAKDGLALQDRLQDLEQKLARRGGGADPEEQKSIGQKLIEGDDFKSLSERGRGTARLGVKAVASITSSITGTGGVGVGIRPDRLAGVFTPPERPFTVRDLIMPGRTSSNAIEYIQETGYQNMAAAQAGEGATKAQSDLKFEMKTTTVKTLAHWFLASKQVLSDLPMLMSYIDGRAIYGLKYVEENQILAGDGTNQNLLGLIPQATAFNESLRKTGDTPIDVLRRAILQVRIAEYRSSAVMLNPSDWADMELQKDTTGSYIWVNVQEGGQQRMWRLPVVDTNAIPQGKFLTGALDMAAQVFDREDAAVEVSTEDGDNFKKNMVTIRAEERLALAVYRPESIIYGNLKAA